MKKASSTLLAIALLGAAGCSDENPLLPSDPAINDPTISTDKGTVVTHQDGQNPPAGLVAVNTGAGSLVYWPFTGNSFDGLGVDPINLVFTGQADPMQVREALLTLDGDRSLLGLPPVYPFDQQWHDAVGGGVQTSFAEQSGWLGSVIQLTLGDYQPVRFHLRLFRTGSFTAAGEPITLGAAHFEVLIPGTSEHQVLSWEVAEQLVAGDLMRSGLLDPATNIGQTGQINPEPSWRTIDPAIYNGLPADLIQLIDGPAQPQAAPVPIATDGRATTVHLAGARSIAPMEYSATAAVEFGQFIPRPFCSSGPYDWLHITGGANFHTTVLVDEDGRYSYEGGYVGTIYATPVDISTGAPVADMFSADVRGRQHGWLSNGNGTVSGHDRKLSHEDGGPQMDTTALRVTEKGRNSYKAFSKCLDD